MKWGDSYLKHKSRKQKAFEYEEKYSGIPLDYVSRLEWLYDTLNINDKKAQAIINKRNEMMSALYYQEIHIILYEEPEGSPRPRFRLINRNNLANAALSNPSFVHVYSITGKEDNVYMNRLMTQDDFMGIQQLLYTPCDIEYCAYLKTPSTFNAQDIFLSEIGLIRPIVKPDWDNIGKKYSDMFNNNVWLDDTLVIDGLVRRFYSVLPRIEIKLKYLNMLYNRYQYNSISNRLGNDDIEYFGRK